MIKFECNRGKVQISINKLFGYKTSVKQVDCSIGQYKIDGDIFSWEMSAGDPVDGVIQFRDIKKNKKDMKIEHVKDIASECLYLVQEEIAKEKAPGKHLQEELFSIQFGENCLESLKSVFIKRKKSKYVVLNKVSAFADHHKEIYFYPGYPEYPLLLPINWAETTEPYDKRSWKYSFNSWVFMDSLLKDNDIGKIRYAIDLALDWYEFNINQVNYNKFAWYDMSVAFRATRIPFLIEYGVLFNLISEDELYKLCLLLKLHIIDLSDSEKLARHSNHGLYQLAGLLAISNVLPELRDATKLKTYATSELMIILKKDVNEEGLHLEHSPAYHVYITEIFNAISNAKWIDNKDFVNLVAVMSNMASLLFHPNGQVVRFGDTPERSIQQFNISNDFMDYIFSKGVRGKSPEALPSVFPKSGYAFFRSNWEKGDFENQSFLAFSAAFHKRTHKHADDFNFEWSEFSQRILIDAGMYGYEREAEERLYVQSTRAHNCVEIDEVDYSLYNLDIFGSAITAWSDNSEVKVVEAYLDRKRFFKTEHCRILFFKPGHWLVVIDELNSSIKHQFTQWFHFHPDLNLIHSLDKTYVDINNKRLWVSSLNDGEKVEHVKAQSEPRLQGWTSIEPYKLTPNDALAFTVESAKEHTFATLFSFGSESAKPKIELFKSASNGKYLRLKWQTTQGETQDIIYRRSNDERELTFNNLPVEVTVRKDS
ncbi:MAG: alginate lyase family protein [Colwellia sp.]|uniref:alginate lyase family protein n=1 Tax=Alteromonadales TaxID=135622 RepID=UPI001D994523|nr:MULTISPECIES: alginate lyase family protein [Alteromonadales]NQZ25652.1 alginate lyase family protein [Colwellia sp.]NRA79908.1 alginate lyase family protein [Pseudoalteromonas sp.]